MDIAHIVAGTASALIVVRLVLRLAGVSFPGVRQIVVAYAVACLVPTCCRIESYS